jgi:aspartate/tyrosine/aromatic aminotransferase
MNEQPTIEDVVKNFNRLSALFKNASKSEKKELNSLAVQIVRFSNSKPSKFGIRQLNNKVNHEEMIKQIELDKARNNQELGNLRFELLQKIKDTSVNYQRELSLKKNFQVLNQKQASLGMFDRVKKPRLIRTKKGITLK